MVATAPRLSIIIATWNAAQTLERCLRSIYDQDFTDWEILIADGASTDNTVSLIRRNRVRIAWWQSQPDNGIYDAWNQALLHARGEYVCFLGADDFFADDTALTTLFDAIGNQDYDLVSSRGRLANADPKMSVDFGSAWDFRRFGPRSIVCHPGLFHRRELFTIYGLFDSSYRIAGDLDFLLRLPEDMKTLHVDAVTVCIESAGISRRNVLARLREQRIALSRCRRYGPIRAGIVWLDKVWRYPIARLFGISH